MQITTIGIDLAKTVFQVHAVDLDGATVIRKRLRRAEVLSFVSGLEPCLIGMEACATSHYWGRELAKFWHTVKLMPPAYVKPYVICGRPQWQAFFGASNDLVGCGHMSGLFARSIYPLALMKSDYRDPYQARELYARDKWRGVPGLRWRPCRSSRLLRAYQTRTYKTSLRMLLAAIGDVLTPSRTFRCGSFR